MATVAIGAQHSALDDLGQKLLPAAKDGDHGYFAHLVSEMVEVKNYRIGFAA